jgi:hypothetical protein
MRSCSKNAQNYRPRLTDPGSIELFLTPAGIAGNPGGLDCEGVLRT